jgi:predicted TIM-barrel fold metal-dependent hydrolase
MTRQAAPGRHAGAKLRAALKHPIIDADAHVLECEFAMLDSLKEVAGARMAGRFEKALGQYGMHRWYLADDAARRSRRIGRPSFWHAPADTRDRATAMLPGLFCERLDEFGIDYAVVYTTLGLSFIHMADYEMRTALCRALNKLNADTFAEHRLRATPAALIPMHTPAAAIGEIEYAVNTLGLKAITVSGHEWRPLPDGQPGRYTDYLALDSEYDYDPVWKKCVELGVVPTCSAARWCWAACRSASPG